MTFRRLCNSLSGGLSAVGVLTLSLLISAPAQAQSSDAAVRRVTSARKLNPNQLLPYKNSVPAQVATARDEGPAGSTVIEGRIDLRRTDEMNKAVALLEQKLRDRNDPLYQQWLTPEEMGKTFPPDPDQVAALTSWLESFGIAVTNVDAPRLLLTFFRSGNCY